ncbi:MAG: glycosyltransferase family 4 protein [Flavipsychrobacter sp.]
MSVIISFPENIIVVGRIYSFFKKKEYRYKVFCWNSKEESWLFWGKELNRSYKKNVTVSALSNVKSIKLLGELVSLIKFATTNSKLFFRHKTYYKGKGIKKYIVALLDDYKLMALKPEVLHFEFGTLGVKKIYLKEILNCKVIVSFRGYDLNYYKLSDDSIYSEVWSKADGFHFLGEDLYKRAKKRGFDSQNKIVHFIPPAVRPEVFSRSVPLELEKRVRPISVISVGRLVWKKGIEYGLLAFKKYLDKGGEGTYHIVGIGPAYEEVEFFIHELGLVDKVIMHGKLMPEETKICLDSADVFFHPSISEGFCNAVIEAQSMEIPVVATDADGLAENIENNVTGFLVKKWDTEDMSDKLLELYRNPELRYKFGKSGRQRVLEKFTVEKQVLAFDKLYKEVYA